MNPVQERAKRRLEAIDYSAKRIAAKIEANPDGPRAEDYKKRLSEYALSKKALDLELETGKPMRIGGNPTPGGVEAGIPTGGMKLEGK